MTQSSTQSFAAHRNLTPVPELYVTYESAQKLQVEAGNLVSHDPNPRQTWDLELLMNGGFNPFNGSALNSFLVRFCPNAI